MKVIEMSVGQEHQINGGQVFDSQAGALDAFEKKKPVRKVRINQHVQVRELDQKRSVPDPGNGNLSLRELRESRELVLSTAAREQRFPDQLAKEGARVEMLRRRQVFE